MPKKAPPPKNKRAIKVGNVTTVTSNTQWDYPAEHEINQPPDNFNEYIRCFFGKKGFGKTTLVASFPKHLTLMAEPKRRGLKIRQHNTQKHTAKEILDGAPDMWQLLKNTTQRFIDDPSVDGLNFDSVDIFHESCYHSVCASHDIETPKDAGRSSSDIWTEIRDEWASYFDLLSNTRLSINLVSHVKERDSEQLGGGKIEKINSPSCSPSCLQYIKQACDFIFFYGPYNGYRAIQLRDPTGMSEAASGVQDKFMQPDGKPINILAMPDLLDTETGYQRLVNAFNNECWDIETPDEEKTPKRKGPPKR
jgi:hypothetical protein